MMACKRLGYDGVAYYSKRVNDEIFALCAINLVLFVDYEGEYSEIVEHMKMDDAFNFGLYKQLCASLTYKDYELRSTRTEFITNIGNYDRQYPYTETKFFDFDNDNRYCYYYIIKFLFVKCFFKKILFIFQSAFRSESLSFSLSFLRQSRHVPR